MSNDNKQINFQPLPRLLFGDAHALVQRDFQSLADQFSHVLPRGDFDSSAQDGFLYKGQVFVMDELVFNHAVNSHLVAYSDFTHHGLSLILAGHSSVICGQNRESVPHYAALLSPPGVDLRFETSREHLTGSLHITFDLERLNRVSLAMQGGAGVPMTQTQLRAVKLQHGPIDLRSLFLQLTRQIDAFAGDVALLRTAGFDDQVYRLLAMALQPEVFLKDHFSPDEQRACRRPGALTIFERYVEEHLQEPLSLTAIEARLGVSARALQYACLKHHGCSPRVYIRNKRLDAAYAHLSQASGTIKLSDLAFEFGFASHSQFSKFFRERFGLLPSQV